MPCFSPSSECDQYTCVVDGRCAWPDPVTRANREPLFPWQQGYPPEWRGNYARLTPAETMLMDWYLDNHGAGILELWFDVRTDGIPGDAGHDVPADLTDDPAMVRMWKAQTSRRMDAVCRLQPGYRIIECRPLAAAQTIGELTQYLALARLEWPELTWLEPVLVTVTADPMVERTLQEQGMTIVKAPPAVVGARRAR